MLDLEKITRLRTQLNLSMAECGRRMGFDTNPSAQWRQIETGGRLNVSIDTAARLAKVLGVKIDDLLEK